jgi:hypothetical protein
VIDLQEHIQTGLDTMAALAALTWSIMGSLADTAVDLISGRELPEPDLQSVATAPEPGATCKVRPPTSLPWTTRSKRHHNEAA